MFPGAGAQVYYNEAGEPIGWDYPGDPPDPYDDDDHFPLEDQEDDEDDLVADHERCLHDTEANDNCPVCIDEADNEGELDEP